MRLRIPWRTSRWMHWGLVYSIPMVMFSVTRLVMLPVLTDKAAATTTASVKAGGVFFGMLQDVAVTTLLVVVLLALDLAVAAIASRAFCAGNKRTLRVITWAGYTVRFLLILTLALLVLAPFAADMLLLRTRGVRFSMGAITLAADSETDPRDATLATQTIVETTLVALLFAILYVGFIDLACGSRTATAPVQPPVHRATVTMPMLAECGNTSYARASSFARTQRKPITSHAATERSMRDTNEDDLELALERLTQGESVVWLQTNGHHEATAESAPRCASFRSIAVPRPIRVIMFVLVGAVLYVGLVYVTYSISQSVDAAVAAIALNATLNELVRFMFSVEMLPATVGGGTRESKQEDAELRAAVPWAEQFIHSETEAYELFKDDSLFRRTTGFAGPLAFDVAVDERDPPNVLVIAVESFRCLDSRYLTTIRTKHSVALTPHFDRWAERGVAFSNMWSSWHTSRSLEAVLFGHVNYDSKTQTGTTTGRVDTELVGMPQFFKQKGYETVFTTGAALETDDWDTFLPAHGFETVVGAQQFKSIAEEQYHITEEDWEGTARRGFNRSVHDDVAFDIISDLIVTKTAQQRARVDRNESKQPFFWTHYTTSSRSPFDAEPAWYSEDDTVPDFSPLCGDGDDCDLLKRYARLRYLTDRELGKFLDSMATAGVLNDTIVVIVGDHGEAPERGIDSPFTYQAATTHVSAAILAQGRLGEYAGTVIDDATQQYDLLSTLADIVGVPDEGYLQTSVGRSLKRQVAFGSRPVWSNNPLHKMAVVRGHERLVYDRTAMDVKLYNTVADPLETNDLLPTRSTDEVAAWEALRAAGRSISEYFTRRMDAKCITKADCS